MSKPLTDRDFAYVEDRLLSPTTPLIDVISRLRRTGHEAEANRLMAAARTLLDECRSVRLDLIEQRRNVR